jgi:hypothetical protein
LVGFVQRPQAPLEHVQVDPVAVTHMDPEVEQRLPCTQLELPTPPAPVLAPPVLVEFVQRPQAPLMHVQVDPFNRQYDPGAEQALPTKQAVPWTPPVSPAVAFVPPTPVGPVAPVVAVEAPLPGVAAVVAPAP